MRITHQAAIDACEFVLSLRDQIGDANHLMLGPDVVKLIEAIAADIEGRTPREPVDASGENPPAPEKAAD